MSIYEISFSPTGGTKKVADFLANELSRDITNVDLSNGKEDFHRFSLTKEDVAVVAVPSYSGRVPSAAAERISKIQGNGAKAIIVCVYGNRAYEARCPVGAIDPSNPAKVNKKACISCMRCVSVCPHQARKVNRLLLAVVNMMLKKACTERKTCELYL